MKAAAKRTATEIAFLKRKPDLNSLYNYFGLDDKSVSDIYVEYILEYFSALTQEDRISHLLFLANRFATTNDVLEKLKKTPCLLQQSKLHCISTFFDPSVRLFRLMLEEEYFPPQANSTEWIPFLRLLGLQTVASEGKLIDFAKKLENEGKRSMSPKCAAKWAEKSRLLFCHLFENYWCSAKETWTVVGSILFLPVKEVREDLLSISQSFCSRSGGRATSFKRSVLFTESNERLCWTSRPLSPDWDELVTLNSDHKNWLGLAVKPKFEDVVTNIKTYVKTATTGVLQPEKVPDPKDVEEMKKVTTCFFEYLGSLLKFPSTDLPKGTPAIDLRETDTFAAKCLNEESKEAVEVLHTLKFVFIPDYVEFASPIQIARKIAEEISPFLFYLPDPYGPYSKLLQRLGVDAEGRPFHYARVLEGIYCQNKDGVLNPNDYDKAILATERLFNSLSQSQKTFGLIPSGPLKPLYLPTREDESKLKLSSELVFLDDIRHEDVISRLPYHFLVDLKKCGLTPLHEETVDFLPEDLRPTMFSKLVGERIDEKSMEKSTSREHVAMAEGLESFLKSKMFVRGLKSVYVDQERKREISSSLKEGFRTLAEKFEVQCLQSFCTSLLVFSGEKELGETSVGDVFLKSSHGEEPAVLYITEAFLDSENTTGNFFAERISDCIQKLLQTLFKKDSVIVGMLLLNDARDIPSCLKKRGIDFLDLCEDEAFSDSPRAGKAVCGKRIFPGDELQMEFNCDFKFDVDEWVAYEEEDDVYIYARIFHKVYERRRVKGDDSILSKYLIDVGQENPIEASIIRIFKFVSRREILLDDQTLSENQIHSDEPAAAAGVVTNLDLEPLGECSTNDGGSRHVSLEEKISEVQRLLSEIWKLDKEDQKRAIKRLYLKWHPDKNDDPDAEEVFKFLLGEVDKGPPKENSNASTGFSTSSPFRTHSFSYSSYYSEWNDYARRFRQPRREASQPFQQGRFRSRQRHYGRAYFSSGSSFFCPPPTPHLVPNLKLGKLYVRQAKADLLAAEEHYDRCRRENENRANFALVCYLCHQCVEKALKGILLCKKGINSKRMAQSKLQVFLHASDFVGRHSENLVDFVLLLRDEDVMKARYPDDDSILEPASSYTEEKADEALTGARGVQQILLEIFSDM